MINKKSKEEKVLIVSNCTWYLYNFRLKLLSDLSNKGYKSSRGKQLTGKLVERMIAKRKISEERGSIQKVEYGDISIEFIK